MQFNHSLKLLNKATVDSSSRLELYTELDNSFKVGDRITVTGGYYDNASDSSFNAFNPFTSTKYVVVAIDPSQNRFTLNFTVSGFLFFPYASKTPGLNLYGDPLNIVYPGYNYYNISGQISLHKGVYISTTSFVRGKFKKGTVQNGVLGCDLTQLSMNDDVYSALSIPNITVSHAVFKNVKIPAGNITNKSYGSGITTLKFKAIENVGSSFPLVSVPTSFANENYGYSYFEGAVLGDTVNPANSFINITANWINSLGFGTSYAKCQLWQPNLSQCRIGDNRFIYISSSSTYGAMQMNAPVVSNFDMKNAFVFPTNRLELHIGSSVSNYIQLNKQSVGTVTYVAPGTIDVPVDYDVIANQYINSSTPLVMVGLLNSSSKPAKEFLVECFVQQFAYSFGADTINGQTIRLYFPSLVSGWASILSAYPSPNTDLDWSNVVFYQGTTIGTGSILQNVLIDGPSEVSTYINGQILPNTDAFIRGVTPTNIKKSFLNRVILDGLIDVNLNDTDFSNFSYIKNCLQMTQFGIALRDWKWAFVHVDDPTIIYEAKFTSTTHLGGSYNGSLFTDVDLTSTATETAFMYGCDVVGRSQINDNQYFNWEYCSFNPTNASFVGPNFVEGGKFTGRRTRFATMYDSIGGADDQVKVFYGAKIYNINTKRVITPPASPSLSSEGVFVVNSSPEYYYSSTFKPFGGTALAPSSSSAFYAMYDLGDIFYNGVIYYGVTSRNRLVIYSELTNSQLSTTLSNVDGSVTSGTYDTRFVNPPITSATPFGIDTNYTYDYPGYYKKSKNPSNNNMMTSVLEPEPNSAVPAGYPQRTGNDPNIIINNFYIASGPPLIMLFYSTPTTTPANINTGVPAGTYSFVFSHYAWQSIFSTQATQVTASFIEIEDIVIEEQPIGGGPNTSGRYIVLDESFTQDYRDDITFSYPGGVPATVTYPLNVVFAASKRYVITMNFWMTTHASASYLYSGYTAKQTYVVIIET